MNSIDELTVQRFRQLIARVLGLQFDERRLDELLRVLHERTAKTGMRDAPEYLDALPHNRDELRVLGAELTTGETYFFRNHEQFSALLEVAVPARMHYRQQHEQQVLRILSAGCSSGEEAYTVAMLLRAHVPSLAQWQVEITGIDVNPTAIAKARLGRYSTWSLRETPSALHARYFTQRSNEIELDSDIIRAVRFEERNLLEPNQDIWLPEHYDIVFCRNVTMYFSEATTRGIVERIAAALSPGGFLFLGHAETLRGISHAFHLHHSHDTFYYQHRDAKEQPVESSQESSEGQSWIETIAHAAERIADMTSRPQTLPQPAAPMDLDRALELLRHERFDDALAHLDALDEVRRQAPPAQLLRAVVLTNRGDLSQAEEVCQQLLQLDELDAEAHYLLALAHEQRGDRNAAVEHDRTAAYLDAAFAMPHLRLALMAKRNHDLDTARRELDEALALLPGESETRVLLFGGGFSRDGLLHFCRSERSALERELGARR